MCCLRVPVANLPHKGLPRVVCVACVLLTGTSGAGSFEGSRNVGACCLCVVSVCRLRVAPVTRPNKDLARAACVVRVLRRCPSGTAECGLNVVVRNRPARLPASAMCCVCVPHVFSACCAEKAQAALYNGSSGVARRLTNPAVIPTGFLYTPYIQIFVLQSL